MPQRRIAFHAPLKAPGHPTPSGDRQMARNLVAALEAAGHRVNLASDLRTFLPASDDTAARDAILAEARQERQRIARTWRQSGPPDLWLCYHPYYKSPDLLGPDLCRQHGVPWVTVEASLSSRRSIGLWADWQDRAAAAVSGAAANIALTARDAEGLTAALPGARVERLAPFLDPARFAQIAPRPAPGHIVTVAMMRPGDKTQSYRMLAAALEALGDMDWRLTVVGDGPASAEVRAMFTPLPADRIDWAGARDPAGVADALSTATVFAWPGYGEAFGLAYLEAQAAAVPVVAQAVAGVPEVVTNGLTGDLTPPGDVAAYALALRRLLSDRDRQQRMARAARRAVLETHGIEAASARLDAILTAHVWKRHART